MTLEGISQLKSLFKETYFLASLHGCNGGLEVGLYYMGPMWPGEVVVELPSGNRTLSRSRDTGNELLPVIKSNKRERKSTWGKVTRGKANCADKYSQYSRFIFPW